MCILLYFIRLLIKNAHPFLNCLHDFSPNLNMDRDEVYEAVGEEEQRLPTEWLAEYVHPREGTAHGRQSGTYTLN